MESSSKRGKLTLELGVQLTTVFAVVMGIALVFVEMRENRDISLAQIALTRLTVVSEDRANIFGEELALVLQKACFDPETISQAESLILNEFFQVQMEHIIRVNFIYELGKFESRYPFESVAQPYVMRVLSYPSGRAWLDKQPYWSNPKAGPLPRYVQSFDPADRAFSCENAMDWVTPTTS